MWLIPTDNTHQRLLKIQLTKKKYKTIEIKIKVLIKYSQTSIIMYDGAETDH